MLAPRNNQLEETNSEYQGAVDEFDSKTCDELRSLQRDNIVILGLLSAIVFAFNAGIALTASVIEQVSTSDAIVMAFIVLTVGLVLYKLIFDLLTFMHKIVRRGAGR